MIFVVYMCPAVLCVEWWNCRYSNLIFRVHSVSNLLLPSSFLVTLSYKLRINLISIQETEILGLKSTLNWPADLINDVCSALFKSRWLIFHSDLYISRDGCWSRRKIETSIRFADERFPEWYASRFCVFSVSLTVAWFCSVPFEHCQTAFVGFLNCLMFYQIALIAASRFLV